MLQMVISALIGLSVTAVPAPDYVPNSKFGISGFVGVTPAPPAAPEPVREEPPSRSGERPPAVQNNVTETPAAQTPTAPAVEKPRPSGGVLGIAASYVGVPYYLGGTTPSGFDCSGYTSYVFNQVGISLPRTAAQQQAHATPVSNPQPGDLVFWGYPAWHVGIYAGNGMVYDAGNPSTGVVYRSVFSGVSGYGRVG